jgi:hypothetical protein
MSYKAPDFDVLIAADKADHDAHVHFPYARVYYVDQLAAISVGIRFRNCYVTNRAIEHAGPALFAELYRSAWYQQGKVLHVSDYREHDV